MQSELKPCPFCGSDRLMVLPPTCDRDTPYSAADRAYPVVRCSGCYTDVPGRDFDASSKSAVEAWNRRSALVDVPAVEPVAPSAIDDLTLPVVGTLYVSRGCATARAVRGVENGPDEYSNLVRISDVAAALEPFRSRLSREGEDSGEVYRHSKRGSTYSVIARGRLQVDGDLDNEKVVIYRGEDGQTWVRPEYEFNDGRFEALAATRSGSATTAGSAKTWGEWEREKQSEEDQ